MNNKYPCSVVQDLLPLYRDNVCGEESRRLVEEHLPECEECSRILEQLNDSTVEQSLGAEAGTVLRNHRQKEQRTAMTAGFAMSGVLLVPVIVCLVCNLALGHALDWFFIVLAALLTLASLTVVPMLASEYKFPKTIGCFTLSLVFLLLVCCIYTRGDWFFVAAVPVIFGLSLVFLPVVIGQIPLPPALQNRKTLTVALWDILWLLAVLAVSCVYTRGDWFFVTAVSVIFGLSLVFLPALIGQVPLPKALQNRKTLTVVLWDCAWLLAILAASCVYVRGDWFLTAAVPVVFGLSVVFLPIIAGQIPLPEPLSKHKAALVMLWDTLWLYGIFLSSAKYGGEFYWHNALLMSAWCLLLPWASLAVIRYTRLHPLSKAGIVVMMTGVFLSTVNDVAIRLLLPPNSLNAPSILTGNLTVWVGWETVSGNVCQLILLGSLLVGGILLAAGSKARR